MPDVFSQYRDRYRLLYAVRSLNCQCIVHVDNVYAKRACMVIGCRDPTHTLLFLVAIRNAYQHSAGGGGGRSL